MNILRLFFLMNESEGEIEIRKFILYLGKIVGQKKLNF